MPKDNSKTRKQSRKIHAEARFLKRAERTDDQQVDLLHTRVGPDGASKERARLLGI